MSGQVNFILGEVSLQVPRALLTPKISAALEDKRYEGAEAAALKAHLTPTDRLLELGAGLGYLAVHAARIIGSKAVTVVEANEALIPVIEDTLTRNHVAGARVVHGAVLDQPTVSGTCDFYVTPAFWASSLQAAENPRAKKVTVPAFGLGQMLEEAEASVLLADVEGAEQTFFNAPLPKGLRLIILELHPNQYEPAAIRALFDRLSAQGFGYCPKGSRGQIVCFQK